MRGPASLRLRLTLWYSLVLGLGLTLFAAGVWVALRHALYSSVESDLRQHVDGLLQVLQSEIEEGKRGPQLREELAEYANAVPGGYSIRVRTEGGRTILAANQRQGGPPRHVLPFSNRVSAGGSQYEVDAAGSLDEADRVLYQMTWMLLLAIPAALGLAGTGGYLLSRRALAPVDEVTAAARSITIQNLSQRLTVPQTGDEIQRLSEAWNDTLARLDAAVKRLTQFTADASHELRTPIALIRTSAEVALRRERAPESYRETLREIRDESERTSQLVDDLLTLARADAGGQALPLATVDLAALVLESGEHARAVASGRELRIAADLPDEPVQLRANAAGLRRLFSVLVDNAVKYTPEGGEVRLGLQRTGEGAEVRVADTGIGMAPEALPHIFERFYRVDASRNRDVGGTGLGLSIAKWIADRHGAEIRVESAEGRGSVFTVRFPQCTPAGRIQ